MTLTADTIIKTCGDLPDQKVAAIEQTDGTLAELEVALAWVAGESDVMGEERKPLNGAARRFYEILMEGEQEWDEQD
jgi:hypothetical protein